MTKILAELLQGARHFLESSDRAVNKVDKKIPALKEIIFGWELTGNKQ